MQYEPFAEVCSLVRSLPIIYLFAVLTVSYMGGAILFTMISTEEASKLVNWYDIRLASTSNRSFLQIALPTLVLYLVAMMGAISNKTVRIVPLFAALKCVLFGFASSYLLNTDRGIVEYALWWFPFQLVAAILFLFFCLLLSPPFFVKLTNRKERNKRGLIMIGMLSVLVFGMDVIVYRWFLV